MKILNRISVLLLLALPFILFSCEKDNNGGKDKTDDGTITITAHIGDNITKTTGDALEILWQKGDAIGVYAGKYGPYRFETDVKKPSSTAKFTGSIPEDKRGLPLTCVYPFSPYTEFDGENISIDIPSGQKTVENKFDPSSIPFVAASSGKEMTFYNVCGFMEFDVENDGVQEITIKGNNGETLGGSVDVKIGNDGKPVITGSSTTKKSISLTSEGGFSVGESYYIAVLPTTMENGYTVTLKTEDMVAVVVEDNPVTIDRGEVENQNTVDEEADYLKRSLITQEIEFPEILKYDITAINFNVSSAVRTDNILGASAADMFAPIYYQVDGTTVNCYTEAPVIEIMNVGGLFFNFTSLKSLDLSCFDTSNMKSMNGMFAYCDSLKHLDISSFDTSNVTDMSKMFYSSPLESLDLSSFDTSNVQDMRSMFLGCRMKSLDLSNFNTSNVTDMAEMFFECPVKSLDISNFDTRKVTRMNGMFLGVDLESLDLSHFNTSNVTDMDEMIVGCRSLKSLNLSGFDFSKLENRSMSSVWGDMESLDTLILDNLNTSGITNMQWLFAGLSSLKSLDLSSFDTSKVTNMREMFIGCSSLENLVFGNFNTAKVENMSEMFAYCPLIKTLDLRHFDVSNVVDMSSMFCEMKSLESVDLSGWNPVRAVYLYGLFYGCPAIKSIELSGWNCPNVQTAAQMFSHCPSLRSVELSGFDISNADTAANFFDECTSLESVTFHNVKAGGDLSSFFYDCSSLKSVDMRGFDATAAKNMAQFFFRCSSLTSADLRGMNTSNVTEMWSLFHECSSLKTVNLEDFNTSSVTAMGLMFAYCSKLESLDLSSFDTSNTIGMDMLFGGCSSLKSLDLSNFVTHNVDHMSWMFADCYNMSSLILGREFDLSKVVMIDRMCDGLGRDVESIEITCTPQVKTDLQHRTILGNNVVWQLL